MYDAPITNKIFRVLRFVVAQQSDLGVSKIAKAVGLSKGTTFGILAGLEKEGYISKNRFTTKYTVGPELFQLSKLIDRRADLASIAKPHIDNLSKKVNRTVFLGVKEDDNIRIEEVAEASGLLTISSSIGTKLPLHAGAPGKVVLSLMRDEEIAARIASQSLLYLKGKRRDEVDIWSGIEEVRRVGYAVDITEDYRPGIWAVAMALDCHARSCPTVVWVAGFKASLNEKKLARIINGLRQTVDDINAILKTRFEEEYQNSRENTSLTVYDNRIAKAVGGADGP
jgi:IclR family transcriptional regulator, KDG regulon repressor